MSSDHIGAARLVSLALLMAVLCNGASVYLKRTGLVDAEAYRAYWAIHCTPVDPAKANAVAEPRCCARATPEEVALRDSDAHVEIERASLRYVFESKGPELVLKLVKDLFGLALIAYSAFLVGKRRAPAPAMREAFPVVLLLGYALVAFLVSLPLNGPLVAVAGLRAFMFVMIALLAQWLAPRLGDIARCLGALLVVQALLIPFELFRGIHPQGEWSSFHLASRVSGTLVLPNSLGIFAVTALAFFYSFSTAKSWLALLSVAALAAIFFSGSATGIICFGLLLFIMLDRRTRDDRRAQLAIGAVLAGVVSVVILLALSGREDLFDWQFGPRGRVAALIAVLSERGLMEVLFGSGLGTGKDVALQLQSQVSPEALEAAELVAAQFTDSTITGLMTEIGLLGAAMFYATLVWAGLRDASARPFYWVVAMCSLTVNITLLFPVNFLLGFAWAHSMGLAPRMRPVDRHD